MPLEFFHKFSGILQDVTKLVMTLAYYFQQVKNSVVFEPRTGHFRELAGFEANEKTKDLTFEARTSNCVLDDTISGVEHDISLLSTICIAIDLFLFIFGVICLNNLLNSYCSTVAAFHRLVLLLHFKFTIIANFVLVCVVFVIRGKLHCLQHQNRTRIP